MTRRVTHSSWAKDQIERMVVYGSVSRGWQISVGRIPHSASVGREFDATSLLAGTNKKCT
jgi:hypothetical protein